MKPKRNWILSCSLLFSFLITSSFGYAQEAYLSNIFITPSEDIDFFSGYLGGDGDSENPEHWLDWSVGNCTPLGGTKTNDMVFSTCTGNFLDPAA